MLSLPAVAHLLTVCRGICHGGKHEGQSYCYHRCHVTANSLHPGFVATRFGDQTGGLIGVGIGIAKRFALTPEQGAETLVYLASSPDVASVTGEYFHKCRPATPTAEAQDNAKAQRLWRETSKIADMKS